LGAADLLRRAMGKKKPEEMAKQREIFTEGAVARQVDAATATHIFDLMEKFAGYGFNKSHSAAYALVSYQTAWLKAHFPAAFMAAVLSSDMDNTDKIVTFIKECADMQLQVRPPCINHSQYHFTVLDDATIIYGLGAVKGVGQAAIECITKEREQGPYNNLFDFCKRLDLRKINRRALEPLIKSGCFDSWQVERAVLQASVDKAIKIAEASHKNQALGQLDLFASLAEETADQSYVPSSSWSTLARLQAEKEVLGFYLSGHPADAYAKELNTIITPIGQLNPSLRKKSLICGQVTGIRKIISKRGKILFIVGLEDATGRLDILVFSEVFEACPLVSSAMAVIEGEIAVDEYNGGVKMTAQQLYSIERARITWARCLELSLSPQDKDKLAPLQALLSTHPGPCPVQLAYSNQEAKVMLTAGRLWQVTPNEDLLAALKSLLGETQVGMRY
jgi:DNA polymerase-3 subunit alpha